MTKDMDAETLAALKRLLIGDVSSDPYDPERIWALCDVDISAQTCEVYAQDTPDGFVSTPTLYVRADLVARLLPEAEQ